ncbi:MAG TPA: acyl-CoA desaturase [Labilithrix sp.]|nr:acyl-CoA desaturase [Labilithrix sp.]
MNSDDVVPSTKALDDEALRADVLKLAEHIRQIGADKRPVGPVVRSWLLGLGLALGGLCAFYRADIPLVARVIAIVLSTLGSVAMATIGHTASHGALSTNRLANKVIFFFTYPFFLMVSARYWHYSHVRVHHGAPNVVGVDDDCDLRPVFGLNEEHAREIPARVRAVQGWLLLVLLPVNGFNIQRQGWRRLLSELGDRRRRTASTYVDLAAMLLHVAVFLVLPAAINSPATALAVYALRVALIGIVLFAILAPGHYPAEAACIHQSQHRRGHFWLRQTATTVNFRTGPIGRWLCSGLEYQIEHHLLPSISHVHLPALTPKVREICHRHGLPHRTLGWGEAILASWRVFFLPKVVIDDLRLLRIRERTSHDRTPD